MCDEYGRHSEGRASRRRLYAAASTRVCKGTYVDARTADARTDATRRSMWMQMALKKPLSYLPRPTDVIVATSPKSGRLGGHQIRTKGAQPDFENQVPDVTFLLEMTGGPLFKIDPNTMVQPADPRIFSTHHLYQRQAYILLSGPERRAVLLVSVRQIHDVAERKSLSARVYRALCQHALDSW